MINNENIKLRTTSNVTLDILSKKYGYAEAQLIDKALQLCADFEQANYLGMKNIKIKHYKKLMKS